MSLAFGPVDIFQVFGEAPQILAEVLQDGVNLAVWRRRLPAQLQDLIEQTPAWAARPEAADQDDRPAAAQAD